MSDKKWLSNYNKIKNFQIKHNTFPNPKSKNKIEKRLANWCSFQRTEKSHTKLPIEQIEMLDQIGFIWSIVDSRWDHYFALLLNWKFEHFDKWPVQVRKERNGKRSIDQEIENSLAVWLNTVRQKHSNKTLEEKWINRFEEIGLNWDYRRVNMVSKVSNKINDYLSSKKEFPKKGRYYLFFKSFVKSYKDASIELEYKKILDKYNFKDWFESHSEKKWDDWLKELADYYSINEKWPSNCDKINKSLGIWLNIQNKNYNNEKLDKKKYTALRKIGFRFTDYSNQKKDTWDKKYKQLQNFIKKNNHFPRKNENRKIELMLYFWLQNQKNWYNGNLKKYDIYPSRKRKLLEKIGFSFKQNDNYLNKLSWEVRYQHLIEFNQKYGRFPKSKEKYPEKKNLGTWFTLQKSNYNLGKLEKDKVMLLKKIDAI